MAGYAPPKGMRDFYPEQYRAREALFDAWRATAELWGFETFDAPVVETLELLERKAGEEISRQLYTFEDKGGSRLALRAELTPSLARMIIARQGALMFPLKWAGIAQCFRYERMQRGRKREHYQWNLDIVGEESILAEAEVIGAAVGALRRLGLTAEDFQVRVGSRALLARLMTAAGIEPAHHAACYLALDKRGKIDDNAVRELLRGEGLPADQVDRLFDVMTIDTLEAADARLGGDAPETRDLRELLTLAEALGFGDFLTFDLAVIRGLGYYTGIVFEAFDTAGDLRAIFGGGRYDNLLSALGGQTMPCVGLGFGDVVVMELLADKGRAPHTERRVQVAVGFMDEASRGPALRIAAALRTAGRSCDLGLCAEKAKRFFNRADRIGAAESIYIGPDEAERGEFRIKDMRSGETRAATIEELAAPAG